MSAKMKKPEELPDTVAQGFEQVSYKYNYYYYLSFVNTMTDK